MGLTASRRVLVYGGIDYGTGDRSNVASNWLLGWWADGKYLSIPIIALLIIAAAKRAKQVEGLLLILVLVNGLYSNPILFPITWFALGLVLIPRVRPAPAKPERRVARRISAQSRPRLS